MNKSIISSTILEEVYKHEDNCDFKHCKHCSKCLKNKEYEQIGFVYCKNCFQNITRALAKREEVYINKEIQYWISVLTDLFCLDHTPIVQIRTSNRNDRHGECWWFCTPIVVTVWAVNGKISLKTLIHEFLHCAGYGHEWEINGWANFGFGTGKDRDRFSRLILRDLTGKDEVWL